MQEESNNLYYSYNTIEYTNSYLKSRLVYTLFLYIYLHTH